MSLAQTMALWIHTHFHRRYTGITRHVEGIVPALGRHGEARALGWLRSPAAPIGWPELLRRVRREPAVWHAHRIPELLLGLALRRWARDLRIVWTRHGTGAPSPFTISVARRADRLVAVSPESAATLGLPAQVIGHGVELDRFHPAADRKAAWDALGMGGERGVGVIGRIREDKGQHDFVQAVVPLLGSYPTWRAVLVGLAKPKDARRLEGVAGQHQVHRTGEQSAVERWFQGLTLAVVPSHRESYGLTRLEAMASGCCLVTTRLNALDREIEHGRTGFLYDAKDVQALGALLEPLLREPTRAERIGKNAAEEARARFGIAHEAEALSRLYAGLHSG